MRELKTQRKRGFPAAARGDEFGHVAPVVTAPCKPCYHHHEGRRYRTPANLRYNEAFAQLKANVFQRTAHCVRKGN